jgi:D-glycero-D-manno-heptose 1,7-bisphosphate phosphatase
MTKRAVFLDRDGVLTELALNKATGEHESAHTLDDLRMCPGIAVAAKRLSAERFSLFIVSNQPSYAKGKTSLENIKAIAARAEAFLSAEGVEIARAFYCYHHPKGVVAEFTTECRCRKPKPQMLLDARDQFDLDLSASWMVGDQETDIECGRRAGCRTVLVENPLSAKRRPGKETPTLRAKDLADAVDKIISWEKSHS